MSPVYRSTVEVNNFIGEGYGLYVARAPTFERQFGSYVVTDSSFMMGVYSPPNTKEMKIKEGKRHLQLGRLLCNGHRLHKRKWTDI